MHPLATGHLPSFFPSSDGSDLLFILVVVAIIGIFVVFVRNPVVCPILYPASQRMAGFESRAYQLTAGMNDRSGPKVFEMPGFNWGGPEEVVGASSKSDLDAAPAPPSKALPGKRGGAVERLARSVLRQVFLRPAGRMYYAS
jgi:hypothetical protein